MNLRKHWQRTVAVVVGSVLAVSLGAGPADATTGFPQMSATSAAALVEPGTLAVALSGSALIVFDASSPGSAPAPVAVTGLTPGDLLVGLDFRAQNGFLYGLGYNSSNGTVQLYSVSYRTATVTAVGARASFAQPIVGTSFGFDFNPTVDRIRVVTDAGQNFRIDPNTGAGIGMDGSMNGGTTTVDAAAYTNNQQNATVTTLYTLSAATNQLFIQNPPNSGTQTVPVNVTTEGAPLDFAVANGFDILPGVNVTTNNGVATGTGLAALRVGAASRMYTIDLATGAATLIGPIGAGTLPIQGLAVQDAGADARRPAIALSADGSQLLRFNTATPNQITTVPISGVGLFRPAGLDWRPQTGQLYVLGVMGAFDTATLYRVDAQTGVATAVGPVGQVKFVDGTGDPVDLPFANDGYGFDFNPTVDRIRVVTNTGLNFRVNPNNGAPVDGGGLTTGINPDGPISGLPMGSSGVSAAAYTNSYGQSLVGGVTTQYVLDPSANRLLIQNPPNKGTVTAGLPITLAGGPLNFLAVGGFDLAATIRVTSLGAPATGTGYAALTTTFGTSLYLIDLTTGAASPVGPIGSALVGLTVGDADIGPCFVTSGAIVGTAGNDVLNGTLGNDVIIGSAGNDTISGLGGNDTICGGPGNDALSGGAGNDQIRGEAGADTVTYASAASGVTASLTTNSASGGAGRDTFVQVENMAGSSFKDTLVGNAGVNSIRGGAGNDSIRGAAGDDMMHGDAGNDVLTGDPGNDGLNGGAGTDTASYATAGARVTANLGSNTASGGAGNDTFVGVESLVGSPFGDRFTGNTAANALDGRNGNDVIRGLAGNDRLVGGKGNDLLIGGRGNDVYRGEAGADTASFSRSPTAVSVDLATGIAAGEGADSLVAVENVTGSRFRDTIDASAAANTLRGGKSNDVLRGRAGKDRLVGGKGYDRCAGGRGFDVAPTCEVVAGIP